MHILIVSACSSRNQNKNGEKSSVNTNWRIYSGEYLIEKKGRIHASKIKGSKKLFTRNKRNRDDLDLLRDEDCRFF